MTRKILNILILIFIVFLAVLAFARLGKTEPENFAAARFFPRGALVYGEFQDLPALVKLWNESELKRKYQAGENYKQFAVSHLAMKLAERFGEYNEALGFPMEVTTLANFSESKAALAVYDIGRMEMIFVAPASEEKILASYFFQNLSGYEETELDGGVKFYSREFEVDRKREKQTVLFAQTNGYFVLATTKPMFLKTLENISGKNAKENLFEEEGFKNLSRKIEPHLATFWVNQEKLNADWYFRHYWIMKNFEDLKTIRAGIFDFEIGENEITERHVFLKTETAGEKRKLSPTELEELKNSVPDNTPFYKIEPYFDIQTLEDVLFDANSQSPKNEVGEHISDRYFYDDYNDKYYSYYDLDDKFDERIDRADGENFDLESESKDERERTFSNLKTVLDAAEIDSGIYLLEPQSLSLPTLLECRKAVVLRMRNPQNLNREKLESVISEAARNHLMLGETKARNAWKNLSETEAAIRELSFPMLRWKFYYAVSGDKLIVSNSADFSKKMLENKSAKISKIEKPLENLTVVRLDRREESFTKIMENLSNAEGGSSSGSYDFFTDNIGSLFDLDENAKEIEIQRTSEKNYLFEEIKLIRNRQ